MDISDIELLKRSYQKEQEEKEELQRRIDMALDYIEHMAKDLNLTSSEKVILGVLHRYFSD